MSYILQTFKQQYRLGLDNQNQLNVKVIQSKTCKQQMQVGSC